MVIGAIAHDVLAKEDPQALARVVALLRSHPQWDTFAQRLESVPEADRDRYLFMIAARWADDVRGNKQYHRGRWHYVNSPVFVAGDEGKVTPPASSDPNAIALLAHHVGQAIEKGNPAPPTPAALGENLLTALAENAHAARTSKDAAGRAVAVCWVMHLVGDLHQPLHTVSLFGADRPRGDKRGNDFHVRVREGGAVIDLHRFWDGLLTGTQAYRGTANLATELRLRPAFARGKLQLDQRPYDWFHDSVVLARDFAYQQGTLRGGTDRSDGPVLPEGYAAEAKTIAERRAVQAGYRLAEVLKRSTAE